MTISERLQLARALVAGGWAGPDCEDAPPHLCCRNTSGQPCSPEDEGLAFYSIAAAIGCHAETVDQFVAMDEALAAIAAPVHFVASQEFAKYRPEEIPALPPVKLQRLALLAISTVGRPTWNTWRTDSRRTLADVLRLFDSAIQKMKGTS